MVEMGLIKMVLSMSLIVIMGSYNHDYRLTIDQLVVNT